MNGLTSNGLLSLLLAWVLLLSSLLLSCNRSFKNWTKIKNCCEETWKKKLVAFKQKNEREREHQDQEKKDKKNLQKNHENHIYYWYIICKETRKKPTKTGWLINDCEAEFFEYMKKSWEPRKKWICCDIPLKKNVLSSSSSFMKIWMFAKKKKVSHWKKSFFLLKNYLLLQKKNDGVEIMQCKSCEQRKKSIMKINFILPLCNRNFLINIIYRWVLIKKSSIERCLLNYQ